MHVLVPLLVVEELDRLKRHNDTKTRARAALKMLNEVFARISQDNSMGRLRRADDTPGPNGAEMQRYSIVMRRTMSTWSALPLPRWAGCITMCLPRSAILSRSRFPL